MQGGVILFRGTGADALRYIEADRSRADDYYLSEGTGVEYAVLDGRGEAVSVRGLSSEEYAGWVDWVNPDTGEQMGRPRLAGSDRRGSPRFAEMVINAPKSLSIAAALHPEVSEALDAAQHDALAEIRRWLAQHSVTRAGPRGAQEVVPIEHLQVAGITHRTSRAGDPHRHIHMQIGTRVWAAGAWRALDTAALFKQQGAIRALGTAVIAAHPQLAAVLQQHDLTLDPVTGEVAELEPFNALMSKRGEQVRKNLAQLEAEWQAAHPGEALGPVVLSRLTAQAWAHERPAKKPTTLREEEAWVAELRDAGYDPHHLVRRRVREAVASDEVSVQQIASRTLDRCAAGSSAWTRHTVQEHATRIITETGVRATVAELRELIDAATRLALEDCFSILPPGAPTPEHVAHYTSLRVVQAETELRDLITSRVPTREPRHPDVREAAEARGLDAGQEQAAAAVASADPLVIVEGAAGAGKTTMLGAAIEVAAEHGRAARVVAPTLRAAQVAQQELGVPASSVAALVHAHGYRWNRDGVWTRLTPGDTDPETGHTYRGPSEDARLSRGERVIVDEAGMLDQDTAIALLTVTGEAGAVVALVGDRAQLPAVGRGGVLDMAAHLRGRTLDMAVVHRFTDPAYADLTLRMRDGRNPGEVYDQLTRLGLIRLHASNDDAGDRIAQQRQSGEAITVATNDEARALNARIRDERVARGEVDDTATVYGSDGLPIGAGDLIQTRKNHADMGVANRQQWVVQHVADDGALSVLETGSGRKRQRTVRLPAEYVAEHAHLSYAATAYGVQGATVTSSHTILTDATSAAGVYVGMTRGREQNLLHIIADHEADARAQFIEAMARDRADRGLTDATARAAEEVRGLVKEGPIKFVNTEVARLLRDAEHAERLAARWEVTAARLDQQRATHKAEDEQSLEAVRSAEALAAQARTEVLAELMPRAEADGAAYLAAVDDEQAAHERVASVGRLGRRKARQGQQAATKRAGVARARLQNDWGTLPDTADPHTTAAVTGWAQRVAGRRANDDPRVTDTSRNLADAQAAHTALGKRHNQERLALLAQEIGVERVRRDPVRARFIRPEREAATWHATALTARREAAQLRALRPEDAAARIAAARAAAEHARTLATERAKQLHAATERQRPSQAPGRDRPGLSL
ncbi:MAG: MobF family relaxase [Leucobacter sp.]